MIEGVPKQFSSPAEEIEYLRTRIAERERELLDRTPVVDQADVETIGRQEIKQYMSFTPKMVLEKEYALPEEVVQKTAEAIVASTDPVEDILTIAHEKGIKNALSVLEQTNNSFIIDEVHRKLIEQIRAGAHIADLREGLPPWHILHMVLYEVMLPAQKSPEEQATQVVQLMGVMEQLLVGLRTIGSVQSGNHFAIEIAVADGSDDIVYYVAVPHEFTTLFEKQTLSLFPKAVLTVQPHDYNIFADAGVALISELSLKKHPIYPLKSQDEFTADPFSVLLNAFSKIEREGGGAAIQFIVRYPQNKYLSTYESIIKEVERGVKPSEAISRSTMIGEFRGVVSDLVFKSGKKEQNSLATPKEVDTRAVEQFRKKITTDIVETNIRLAVSAKQEARARQIMAELESALHQYSSVEGNAFAFTRPSGSALKRSIKAFSFRELSVRQIMPLSIRELATVVHFPESTTAAASAPQLKQSHAKTAPAPNEMPTSGTLLGINRHRGLEREIFSTELDRMRHFYIIGQTGTGKTTLMKNMIVQDIARGDGVCLIDPHGTDIEDILASIPPHREQDVIYFDPSRMDRVIGLNMLEYDYTKPEQKTFVVNEMLSIFNKLFDMSVAGGPMFEQYFRNATMLVMEDPESGNTLMDIGRVLADARYRRMKLEKARNPVVVQFWREIAGKAGGEASLENIVPYIVSKFDVFTANDYMRPIIGQQRSAFNFRLLMDERKILLVNLSKGRMGEINSNLIGMIFVGKLLMAALSRVDDPTMSFSPFYLHIDEFQNISTNSIASILSEARKYKLGLTMAHQFIAQLQPEIKDAVFGNVGSMAAFRVGPEDAQFLEQQFSPIFTASDLMNIPNRNAYVRVLAHGTPTPPFSIATVAPPASDREKVARIIEMSYARYGRPREEIEMEIQERYQKQAPPPLS